MNKWIHCVGLCGALAALTGCATGPRFQTPESPKSDSLGGVSTNFNV